MNTEKTQKNNAEKKQRTDKLNDIQSCNHHYNIMTRSTWYTHIHSL